MRDHAAADVVAWSPGTGETYSANPNDYVLMGGGEYLKDDDGHAMVLAKRIPTHYKPLEAA